MPITKQELEAFVEREERRLALQREVDALESANKPLRAQLLERVREFGGSDRTTVHHGFVLKIDLVAGRVSWVDEFVREKGVEAKIALQAKAPKQERLRVEKAA